DAQCFPLASAQMSGQEYDLAGVLGVVRDLAVDGLHHSVRLPAHCHRMHDMLWLERIQGGEDAVPAFFPPLHYFRASGSGAKFKFAIAKTVGLFAIRREEVGETRSHIACEVLDQNRNGIRFRVDRDEEILVIKLRHGALGHALVSTELALDFVEIVGCEISGHFPFLSSSNRFYFASAHPQPPPPGDSIRM